MFDIYCLTPIHLYTVRQKKKVEARQVSRARLRTSIRSRWWSWGQVVGGQ